MKKIYLLILLILFFKISSGQSIRKNHLEMTQSEKDELVIAFKSLYNNDNLLQDLNNFYYLYAIPDTSLSTINISINQGSIYDVSYDIFLAWHRKIILEVEQALQIINPNISIPYWDWTTDDTSSSSMWNSDFMASSNFNWTPSRYEIINGITEIGAVTSLPGSTDISNHQLTMDWENYSKSFQNTSHVGMFSNRGASCGCEEDQYYFARTSPNDPAFYIYFSNLDRLWEEWSTSTNIGITNSSDLHALTTMPRFDGTYSFNNQTIASVDPDNLIESSKLGVFYAGTGIVELEGYTVSNSVLSEEVFYYKYTIEAKNGFTVPVGKSATLESVNEIILKPGFSADNGSTFIAKIVTDNDINTNAKGVIKKNNTEIEEVDSEDWYIKLSPNPASDNFVINFEKIVDVCNIQVYNSNGSVVLVKEFKGQDSFRIDIANLSAGMYYVRIIRSDAISEVKKILKI